MSEGLYRELGVAKSASADDIQRAYRKLAKKYHPDANPGDKAAEERFKKISSAYAILKDTDQRARYDRGEIDDAGNERAPFGGMGGFHNARAKAGQGGFEYRSAGGFGGFDDILSDLFGGFASGGGNSTGGGRSVRGGDIHYRTSVDFIKAAAGGNERVRLQDGRQIEVTIPAGLTSGTQLRLRGKGHPGNGGNAPSGDLLLEVEVRPHPDMRRDGLDIIVDQPVPLETAVNGGKVRVKTINGEVSLSVPAWSSSGQILRMRGRGIHDRKSGGKGDQLVRLMITLPEKPDPALQDLFNKAEMRTD